MLKLRLILHWLIGRRLLTQRRFAHATIPPSGLLAAKEGGSGVGLACISGWGRTYMRSRTGRIGGVHVVVTSAIAQVSQVQVVSNLHQGRRWQHADSCKTVVTISDKLSSLQLPQLCAGANCLRARRNLAVTNQLIHEATKQGFKSVHLLCFL